MLIEDESLSLYKDHFKVPMVDTEKADDGPNLRREVHAGHTQTIFIQKGTFL